MRGRNSIARKIVYRPITNRDREFIKAELNRLREQINPKQTQLKLNP